MLVPIVFAINKSYIKQLATVITSIMQNNYRNNDYEFHILFTDISDKNQNILNSYVNQLGATIHFVDMKSIIRNIDLEMLMSRRDGYTYISLETYFRYFIPELFLKYEKILYLDTDILVDNDLSMLFEENIDGFYSGVVKDSFMTSIMQDEFFLTQEYPKMSYRQYLKEILKKKNQDYFNAGVLLLNLAKIRNDNVISRLWNFTFANSPLEFQDQDALNAVFENNVKFLDVRWNVLKNWQKFTNDKKQKTPYIIHYVGENKPWICNERYAYDYPMIKEWWDVYKQTPFYEEKEVEYEKKILKKVKLAKVKQFLQFIFLLRNDGMYKNVQIMGRTIKFRRKIRK